MVKVSVVPNIVFRGRVRNMGGDGRETGTEIKEVKFMNELITLDIPDNLATTMPMLKSQVRRRIRERIIDIINENLYKDVGKLIGEEGSPPQLIVIPDDYFLEDEADQIKFLKSIISAEVSILSTDRPTGNNLFFGSERVWRDTPVYNVAGKGTYYEGDGVETCAYDYLINHYGKKHNVKKYAVAYNTTGKRGDKTTGKELIDYWVSLPLPQQKDIYHSWMKKYKDNIMIRDIVSAVDCIYPITGAIDCPDIEDELFTIRTMNIDPDYTEKDVEDTLSLLDILKWCICADVRLSVKDFNNRPYFTYNPTDFKNEYIKNRSNKPAIVIKVEHQHAYFETDTRKIQSQMATDNRQTLDYEELRKPTKKEEKEPLPVEYRFEDSLCLSTPPALTCDGEYANMKHYDWGEHRDQFLEMEVFGGDKQDLYTGEYYTEIAKLRTGKDTIDRLTTDDFISMAKQDKKKIVCYVDKGNLNKVACEMLEKHNTKHDHSVGGIQTIRQLTYGNLTLISRCGIVKRKDIEGLNITDAWANAYKIYPDLRTKNGLEPTAKKVGDYLFSLLNKEPMLSTMNGILKEIFYTYEIKPQNVDVSPYFYDKPVISFDIKKAYTTALETNETYKWCKFDCVSQPTKFSGTINADWFYIGKALVKEYPVKQGKGLQLYHGSLLRHLKDKVEVMYEIQPKEQLPADYFKDFVERVKFECKKKGAFYQLYTFKSIINNFVGGLKRKDSQANYTHYLTKDKQTINRALNNASPPTQVKDSDYWIIPNSWKNTHYQNGSPIRLQVIDMINEQMYRFSKWAEKVFKYPTLSIRTDACYIQTKYDNDEEAGLVIPEVLDAGWNENNVFKFEVEKSLEDWEYERIVLKPVEGAPESYGIRYIPNRWTEELIIDKKWSKDVGANHLINSIICNRGCLIEGQAGRGKSELLLCLEKRCRKNRVKYALYKECLRVANAKFRFDKQRAYRKKHPVSIKMFAPTNKAANRVKGKTMNKGLGIPVIEKDEIDDDDGEEQEQDITELKESFTDKIIEKFAGDGKMKDEIDIVCFEEVSMLNGEMLSYVSYLKQKLPHTIVIMCGDIPHQLPPVGEERRNFAGAYVLKEICNFMRMELRYNFRQDTKSDELWDMWSIEPHRFRPTTRRLTKRNLCRYNATRKKVIELIQDKIVNPVVLESTNHNDPRGHTQFTKIEVGTPMIARISKVDDKLAKNDMYYITEIDDDNITLKNDEDNELTYTTDTLLTAFQSGYCITIHKSQGETYDDEYTIWDWRVLASDKSMFGRKLRYVAQSRSTNPEKLIKYQL
tara:strand:- start:52 stop:3930 length:3879 start_codon:yes stop_codon:yes gene_type:complete